MTDAYTTICIIAILFVCVPCVLAIYEGHKRGQQKIADEARVNEALSGQEIQ